MTTKVVVVFDLSLRFRPVCWIVVCPKYQLGIAILALFTECPWMLWIIGESILQILLLISQTGLL